MPPPHYSSESPPHRLRGLLNKITVSNFDALCPRIINVFNVRPDGGSVTEALESSVTVLVDCASFDRTRSELYGRLVERIVGGIDPNLHDEEDAESGHRGGALFRKTLLKHAQELFEQAQESVPSAAQKSRFIGLLRFLVELFKVKSLTERIMHEMVKKMLTQSLADLEYLHTLLTAAGQLLDTPKARAHMDVYFSRIRDLKNDSQIPTRIKFRMEELVNLRDRKWVAKAKPEWPDQPVAASSTQISSEEIDVLSCALDTQLAERNSDKMCRFLSSLDQDYVPTVVQLLLQNMRSSTNEGLQRFVCGVLAHGAARDIFFTSDVAAGFQEGQDERGSWTPPETQKVLEMMDAAGLRPKITIVGFEANFGALDILKAVGELFSMSIPAAITEDEFERWVAELKQKTEEWIDRAHAQTAEAVYLRELLADQREDAAIVMVHLRETATELTKSRAEREELAHARDLAEKMCNSEKMRRMEADVSLRISQEDVKRLQQELEETRQRSQRLEEELRVLRSNEERRTDAEAEMKDTARDDGRQAMLAEMMKLLTSKREEERREREGKRADRESAQRREQEAKRRAERLKGAAQERERCLKRDEGYINAIFWTAELAFRRFEQILLHEEFAKIKFADGNPLIFQAIPWPTVSKPGTYGAVDVTEQSVRRFFESRVLPNRKYIFRQALLAFHDDKMSTRLSTIHEEDVRREIGEAAKRVTQTLNDLMSETE
ncbi:hypothetical protein FB45DRAFT_1065106 [Roridomyces roridus]|uniref:MIF4G domain-containing protein n=1 Tax=Roridomyces roridus TaxID=1738132 RepID=A0AAD7B873_9AGAR|nr:hypothetical protein FB45DRAFT_1065106 [Roridomyces roridus]